MERETNVSYFEVLHAPYVRGFSEILSLQTKLGKVQIGFVSKKRETLYTRLCKQKIKFEKYKDVVYLVPVGNVVLDI